MCSQSCTVFTLLWNTAGLLFGQGEGGTPDSHHELSNDYVEKNKGDGEEVKERNEGKDGASKRPCD